MKTNKWYVGCLNDAPFIIDAPPRPSTDDCVHDREDGPGFVVRVHGLGDQDVQDIITEHNRVVSDLVETKAYLRLAHQKIRELMQEAQ